MLFFVRKDVMENTVLRKMKSEDVFIYNRILRMTNTSFYRDLSDNKKEIVLKIIGGYQNRLENKEVEKDQYILSGLELIEIDPDEDVADTPLIPTTSAGEIDPTADVPA